MTKLYLDNDLIDLYGNSGIAINYGNSNIEQLSGGSTKGTFSYEIKIPATKNNKKILYFPELVLSESFDDELEKNARLEVNGNVVLDGYARIKGVIQNKELTEYKIVLFEGNSSWIYSIKGKTLKDIDYTFLDHTYNLNNVLGLPTNQLVSYPLISFGEPVNGYGQWSVEDFVPSFNVRRLFRDIFWEAGYTINSNFLDSEFFKKLYITTDKFPEKRTADYIGYKFNVGTFSTHFTSADGGNVYYDKPFVIPFDTDSLSNDINFYNTDDASNIQGVINLGTQQTKFQCAFNGKMSFVWEYTLFNKSRVLLVGKKAVDYELRLNRVRNGVSTVLETREVTVPKVGANTTIEFLGSFTSSSYTVKSGDSYFFSARLLTSTSTGHDTGISGTNTFRNKVYSTLIEGDTIYINDNIPDIEQSSFISDIKTAFNLYFLTDEISKVVTIEPRNDFYLTESEDWTSKIDLSKSIEITHLGDNLGKTLEFSYADDSNDKYVKYKEESLKNGNKWLSKEVSVTNLNAKDTTTSIKLTNLATTFVGSGLESAPSAKIPLIWNTENEEKPSDKVKKFKPRLLYYRGKVNLKSGEVFKVKTFSYSWYPQFTTNYVATDGVYKHENSLDFDESPYGLGLYNIYYKNTVNTINNSRRFNAYIKLNSTDIENLNLRKPKYIEINGNGNYYILEVVNGYKPESVDSVQCSFVMVTEDAVNVDKYVSPINIHEYPAKQEDNEGEILPELFFPGHDVVMTELVWMSTTDNPNGEFVTVYSEVKANKTDSLGNIYRGQIETVQHG